MCYRNKTVFSLIGILLLGVAILGFGPEEAFSAEDINIAIVGPMTGENSEIGISGEKNVKLMADQMNARGGIQGRLMKVQVEDDRFDLKETAAIAARLVADKKIIAVVGPSSSVTSLAAVPIYKKGGLVTISHVATSDKVSGISPFYFRTITMDFPNAKMSANYIVNILGAKKVAAIYALQDGTITQARSVMKEVVKLGGKIVREETHMEGDKDFTAQLTKIIAEKPDLIFTSNFYPDAATQIRQAKGLGYNGLIMGSDGAYSNELIKIAGKENVEGFMCWAPFFPGSANPVVQKYVQEFKAKYKGEVPDAYGSLAYDAAGVIVTALQKTIKDGKVDRKSLRDYIAGIGTKNPPYQGVTGVIKFDANGDVETPLKIVVIRNGEFQLAPKQLE
jgi:branched-chain amino acid transport system substrate-binding protein